METRFGEATAHLHSQEPLAIPGADLRSPAWLGLLTVFAALEAGDDHICMRACAPASAASIESSLFVFWLVPVGAEG